MRTLGPHDVPALKAFLDQHRASSLFLRANLINGGIEDGPNRSQGLYVGAFDGDVITDVAAHYWNNNVILQAPNKPLEMALAVVKESGRAVNGVIGPWAQVQAAEPKLDLDRSRLGKVVPEYLYALQLKNLRTPSALDSGAVWHRRAQTRDLDILVAWRRVYDRFTMGFPEHAINDAHNRDMFVGMIADQRLWVLVRNDQPVAMSNFSAALPDTVQVGGVYADEAQRSQGHGRSVVAGALLDARDAGATEALLFTEMDNVPAQRAYESLGFEQVGDYAMVVLDPS